MKLRFRRDVAPREGDFSAASSNRLQTGVSGITSGEVHVHRDTVLRKGVFHRQAGLDRRRKSSILSHRIKPSQNVYLNDVQVVVVAR